MPNDFYVYFHKRESDNSIFYVGKGKSKRAYSFSGRSERWKRTAEKHGVVVEIYKSNLSEEQAFELEKLKIAELRESGENLCNLTDGGEGSSGVVVKDETKILLSKKRKEYIEENKSSVLQSIKKAQKAKSEMVFTEEIRLNMSNAQKGKKQSIETVTKRMSHFKDKRANSDNNDYLFINEDNEIFLGKRYELAEKFNFKTSCLNNLFCKNSKPLQSAKGWYRIADYVTFQIFINLVIIKFNKE